MVAQTGQATQYGTAPSETADSSLVQRIQGIGETLQQSLSSSDSSEDSKTQNIVAQLSRSLDYERAASEASEGGLASGIVAENGTGVSSTTMDYSDSIKPMVSPLLTSRSHTESRLEQQRAGDSPSGSSAMLPSMDSISEYLVRTQAQKLDEMIAVLNDIKAQMGASDSQIVGANGQSATPMGRPGVKSIAQDMTRGRWDLTYGDNSSGSVTTEGRGGSA